MTATRQRVHWLQHADHEGLGCIGPWLAQRGHAVTHTALHRGGALPRAEDLDWLLVLGGPMNVYEHDAHPWLVHEKAFLRDVLSKDKKVLGICLGAQLLADVLGGRVTRNSEPEIGFFTAKLTPEAYKLRLLADFPAEFLAFQWHEDTFSMPPGCANLAKSDACVNQIFARGRSIGLQFHLEVTQADAGIWLTDPPAPRRYVQAASDILRATAHFEENNRLMLRLLRRMEAV